MAALQQSPVAFHLKSPLATRIRPKTLFQTPFRSSFSSNIPSLKLAFKLRTTGRSGGAKMMDTAAGSYAAALADVAKTNGSLDATLGDLEKVQEILAEEKIFNFFMNPTVELDKKKGLIEEIAKSSTLQPHVTNFLNIVIDMNRMELFKDIVKEFEVFYNKLTETELAIVTSVVKLDSQHLAQIAQGVQRLTGAQNVRIKTVIDPSLVAGFTIRYGSSGSKLIDMSVKKQLDDIASQLEFGDMVGSLVS